MKLKNAFFSFLLATYTFGAYAGAPTQDAGKPEQTAEQSKPEAKPAEVQQEKPVLEKPVVEKPVIQQEKPVLEKPVQEQMQGQSFERLQGAQGEAAGADVSVEADASADAGTTDASPVADNT